MNCYITTSPSNTISTSGLYGVSNSVPLTLSTNYPFTTLGSTVPIGTPNYIGVSNSVPLTLSTNYPFTSSGSINTSNYFNINNTHYSIPTSETEQVDLSKYPDTEATQHEYECIICMTNRRQIVLNPCGHYNMCITCTDKIMKDTKKCPVCQKNIITAIKAFE